MIKYIIILILFLLYSCGYPDIDSVPDFKDVNLSKDELFDLCEFSSADKSEIDRCMKENQNKQ